MTTLASEVLRKLHKSDKIGNMNAEQFLLSVLSMPEMWTNVPFIICKNKKITFNHDLTDGFCAYSEMFDSNGRYKLEAELAEAFAKPPGSRSGYEKDLIKLDEQINILHQLMNRQLIRIFPVPEDSTHHWYAPGDDFPEAAADTYTAIAHITDTYLLSVIRAIQSADWNDAGFNLAKIWKWQTDHNTLPDLNMSKIRAERVYTNVNIYNTCKKLYLLLGAAFLMTAVARMIRPRKIYRWFTGVFIVLLCVSLLFHIGGIGLRWYISGRGPWSNSYETMVLLSLLCILAGLLFARRNIIPLALSTLLAGVILFVSGLNWMNPQITPLVPVLKSPWLMIHVALVMVSYGFFGISCLLGLTNLVMMRVKNSLTTLSTRIRELTIINEMSLLAGLAFLCGGVFIGAVWANESWGRYWGWDPKETWALITIIVYAVAVHLRLVKKWNNPFLFNLISVLAFACVLMTYFGVNYLLSGMHSYN